MENYINIIGAGLAGLASAIKLARSNIKSNLISNSPSERAQSVLAEGGINAVLNTMGENDTILEHFNDTKKGGAFIEPDENINQLVNMAPQILDELIRLGVPFQFENNKIIQRNFGGQKKKRTAYAKSSTGKMIMTALIDEVRKYEAKGLIKRYDHHECVDFIINDNNLSGVIIKDTYTDEAYKFLGTTILAVGGLNGFFDGNTTGSNLNNANLQSRLFRLGGEFRNLEFIQFHPTTVDISTKRLLISEAARGEGARLFVYKDNTPYYFMEDKYELGNLSPRDVISKEEYLILNDPNYDNKIYLDMTCLSKDTFKNKLSDLRKEIIEYLNIDPMKEPIPVTPGIHFFMGGIKVNICHQTSINNLYATGEAASIYHGANRLGGNSMLGALCGGIVAARDIISNQNIIESGIEKIDYKYFDNDSEINQKIKDILLKCLGIMRSNDELEDGINEIKNLLNEDLNEIDKDKCLLALAMIKSAHSRLESRGSHNRIDYPSLNDSFKGFSISKYENGSVSIDFERI